jgi:hypothetical protein
MKAFFKGKFDVVEKAQRALTIIAAGATRGKK